MSAKYLNGLELAGFIKERQAKTVRGLIQSYKIKPKLAIVQTIENDVIDKYVSLKQAYGNDILIDVDLYKIDQNQAKELIQSLNKDDSVHGIIVQLPLHDPTQTDELCNLVDPQKDVDALGQNASMQPATPMAILWLLAGYNITLENKNILVVGNGRLVGKPLSTMLQYSGYNVTVATRNSDLMAETLKADIIISATGSPSLIKADMLKPSAVVVDAGTASESGKIVGDLDQSVFDRDDLTITPQKGGVGPLTICALFENVINSANIKVNG